MATVGDHPATLVVTVRLVTVVTMAREGACVQPVCPPRACARPRAFGRCVFHAKSE